MIEVVLNTKAEPSLCIKEGSFFIIIIIIILFFLLSPCPPYNYQLCCIFRPPPPPTATSHLYLLPISTMLSPIFTSLLSAPLPSCRRYDIQPVCADLQGQILACYRENVGKTLNCSNIASLYLQCVNEAKQQVRVYQTNMYLLLYSHVVVLAWNHG